MKTILRSDPEAFEGDEEIIYPEYEILKEMFKYKIRPTDTHREIINQMELYILENEKFMKKKNRKAARRARKALLNLFHLVRARRAEMLAVYKEPSFYDYEFIK
jgi:hypothetical protein